MAGQRTEIELLRAVIDTQRLLHAGQHGVDEVMAIVTDRSRELTGAEAAVVELVEGAHLRLRAASGSAVEYLGSRMDAAGSLSGRCIADREAHRCDDAELDERVNRALCRQVGVRSSAAVPLVVPSGECLGALTVFSSQPDAFDDGDLELLDAMGDFVATAVRQAARRQLERIGPCATISPDWPTVRSCSIVWPWAWPGPPASVHR